MQMTYESMMIFDETWIAAWNRRDVEGVLAHFAEEAQFVSPVARNFVGRPVLRNKKEGNVRVARHLVDLQDAFHGGHKGTVRDSLFRTRPIGRR